MAETLMDKKFDYIYVTADELYMSYKHCLKRKKGTENAQEFMMNESLNLSRLYYDLNSWNYQIGKSIAFIISEPVYREVFAADFRDRIVHHLIIDRTMKYFEKEFDDDAYSCREGKGVDFGVNQCYEHMRQASNNFTKDTYVLKCDLKSFFMTIDKDKLYEKLSKFIDKHYKRNEKDVAFIKHLIKLVVHDNPQNKCIKKSPDYKWNFLPKNKSLFYTDENHGLPIGNLTSQIFANFYLNDFDKFVKEELGFIHYGRYVDDFYIYSNDVDSLIKAKEQCTEKLKQMGVTLHPNKIYVQNINKGLTFIGSMLKPNCIFIGKRTYNKFKSTLYHHKGYMEWLKEHNKIPTKDYLLYFVTCVNSYIGFMRHKKTFNIRKELLLNKKMKIFYDYCYFDKDLTKLILYKEYTKGMSKKHRVTKEYAKNAHLIEQNINILNKNSKV